MFENIQISQKQKTMKYKTKPLNNPQDFKIPPKKIRAIIPEEELIIGGDAPRVPKNLELITEVEKEYQKFKMGKK
jgi:hypothetical protein